MNYKRCFLSVLAVLIVLCSCGCSFTSSEDAGDHDTASEQIIPAVTIGTHELSSTMMNYFFRDAVDSYYNYIYSYFGDSSNSYLLASDNLDVTKPLNSQIKDAQTGTTWADYFLEQATANARYIYAMCDQAKTNNFTLPEERQAAITSELNNLQFVVLYGYESADAYLRDIYGKGANTISYKEFLTLKETADAYCRHYYNNLSFDKAQRNEYDNAHPHRYDSYSFNYFYLDADRFLPAIEGTRAEDGNQVTISIDAADASTFTEDDHQAALDAAKTAAESLCAATNIDEFERLYNELSGTINSKSTEINDIFHSSSTFANYADWLSEDSRKPGDTKVFPKTSTDTDGTAAISGYYVLMFRSKSDNRIPCADIYQIMIAYEGGTDNVYGGKTYSDDEKQIAYDKAEKILTSWRDGDADIDAFIKLVKENGGDSKTDGLIKNVNKNSSQAYRSWALAADRQKDDVAIIPDYDGCYIVFYKGISSLNYRDYMISCDMRDEAIIIWEEDVTDAMTVKPGNTSDINLSMIYIPSTN